MSDTAPLCDHCRGLIPPENLWGLRGESNRPCTGRRRDDGGCGAFAPLAAYQKASGLVEVRFIWFRRQAFRRRGRVGPRGGIVFEYQLTFSGPAWYPSAMLALIAGSGPQKGAAP